MVVFTLRATCMAPLISPGPQGGSRQSAPALEGASDVVEVAIAQLSNVFVHPELTAGAIPVSVRRWFRFQKKMVSP